MKTIMFVGEGRAGKDTACDYLAEITTLRNAGTTSKYLSKYVAKKLGISEADAYARRHESDEMRILWYNTGNEVRTEGPTTLAREALLHGEITGGLRDLEEIRACRVERVADLIVWVENKRVKKDPTVMFTSAEADIVIENNGTLEEFYERLTRFAKFASLPMKCGAYGGMIQKVSVFANLGREDLSELGRCGPYRPYVKFPTEDELESQTPK